jgi:hypothetical protein
MNRVLLRRLGVLGIGLTVAIATAGHPAAQAEGLQPRHPVSSRDGGPARAPATSSTPRRTTPTGTITARVVLNRTRPQLTGIVSTGQATVTLQDYFGGAWRRVSSVTARRTGAFVFNRVPFARLRVTSGSLVSRTVDAIGDWRAGFGSLGLGNIGLAIAPLNSVRIFSAGNLTTGIALSTFKTVIVYTADRHQSGSQENKDLAIEHSDNGAAQALYDGMGPDHQAYVNATLHALGATRTSVNPQAWGHTEWPVKQQATFASQLACAPGNGDVLNLMHHVVPSQAYGFGQTTLATHAAIKGGWNGDVVRQLAVITIRGRVYGVSMLSTGGYSSGVAKLRKLATWVANRLAEFPAAVC